MPPNIGNKAEYFLEIRTFTISWTNSFALIIIKEQFSTRHPFRFQFLIHTVFLSLQVQEGQAT